MRQQVAALAAVAVILCSALLGFAQDRQVRGRDAALATTAMLAGFNITVARTSDGASLACETGCAWKTLTFVLTDKPTTVSTNGIAGVGDPEQDGLFLLHLKAKDGGFELTCRRGCAWRTMGWRHPANGKPVAINEYGMAVLHSQRQ